MSSNVRVLQCAPADVFEVLAEGWLYPSWVVGASRMRDVDATWPQPGSELHHSVGVWPVLINDKTVVEEYEPPRRMVMRARGWPVGEARVTLQVKERGSGCVVRIHEEAIAGPGRLVPRVLMDAMLHWRNAETLHRLAYLAEGRAAPVEYVVSPASGVAAEGEGEAEAEAGPATDADGEAAAEGRGASS
ncbi:SRPBCC family protein [Microbacterium sp. XT11]|uniref:SRPBCC family protein n=1 Tax=Microbacterium sp. XT11 TaxID=367477 RepID=UPI0008353092|nr:SRPBCC family protein [Microbacterium sp. XT11]